MPVSVVLETDLYYNEKEISVGQVSRLEMFPVECFGYASKQGLCWCDPDMTLADEDEETTNEKRIQRYLATRQAVWDMYPDVVRYCLLLRRSCSFSMHVA